MKDDFSDLKSTQRHTLRGDWNIADGMATCRQDDELYKKHKDHGHIRDMDASILHLLGIDHERFTYKFRGLNQRLTGVEKAHVIKDIMA